MKKLSVRDLVEFRKRSDRGKKTFVENIKLNKAPVPSDGGGDYWTISLSAICSAYKWDDLNIIDEKVNEVQEKLNNTKHTGTKTMYQRNLSILHNYLSINVKRIRPSGKLSFQNKSTGNSVLTIKGLQVEVDVKRLHVYTFGKKDEEIIGAIWFITKVNGYRIEEVGMFCDMLYRFLKHNYSKSFQLSSKFCTVVDMLGNQTVTYSSIENGTLSSILNSTLDEINKLM